MHDPSLEILDKSLVTALELFVLICFVYLAASFWANRRRNREIMKGLERRFERDHPGVRPDPQTRSLWQAYLAPWDGLGASPYGLLWSAAVGCLAFLFLCFSPFPTMKNFATVSTAQPPLRVTFLYVDPGDKGFEFQGDVWNQSETSLPVRASITFLDSAGKQVGEATAPVAQKLPPRGQGQFTLESTAPAQATDFRLHFVDADNEELAYAQGFPNTPEVVPAKPAGHQSGRTALSALRQRLAKGRK